MSKFKTVKMSGKEVKKFLYAHPEFACGHEILEHYAYDVPVIPEIDARILESIEKPGNRLNMRRWHGPGGSVIASLSHAQFTTSCKTTHCRAGWAIHIAGKQGYELENRLHPSLAGGLIYLVSRPHEQVPNFYCIEDDYVLDDIRKCAARQTSKTLKKIKE